MKIPQDVIIQINHSGHWILYNVFTKETLAVTDATMELVGSVAAGNKVDKLNKLYSETVFPVWDITVFSNYEGLLADPTRRIREFKNWPKPQKLSLTGILEILKRKHIVIEKEAAYKKIFRPKRSLLDAERLGNFHEQLGRHLLLEKREDPGEWWVKQKFNRDYTALNDNLYRAVQGKFLDKYIKKRFRPSSRVLDIGCGTGYYTNLMGKTGADVLGIDPNKEYVEIAKKNFSRNASFKVSGIGNKGDLKWIKTNSYDTIFMSDALLFYFVSPDPKQKQNIKILFSDIRRILVPGGKFISVEPSGLFWLKPWLGELDRPFTVLTEYNHKRFNVTPNYGEIIRSFIDGGFVIKDMRELSADDSFAKQNLRATNFSKEFPLWWFFEMINGK